MDRLGERGGVADLHRQPLLRPVQHGLAVEADDIDLFAADVVLRGEGGDRFGMGLGHGLLGLAQDAGLRVTLRQMHGLRQRLPEQAALALGIGAVAARPEEERERTSR